MTQREIAAALEITQSQVHRALRRAHEWIADTLTTG
jgi:DNA-binding transcriptional regulator LsrR (DeoR family)